MPRETTTAQLVTALEAVGFNQHRRLGRHVIMGHRASGALVTLPARSKVSPQMLRVIVRQVAGFGLATEEQFLNLLEPDQKLRIGLG